MKKMTCKELGGACDVEFSADSFDGIAELSKKHGIDMFMKGDQPHLDAMQNMKSLMENEGAMEKWYEEKRSDFESR